MKKIFIILVAFVCTLQTNMLFAQDITFRFPILNGEMSLEGTITLPENFSAETPVLILVSPPQASSRDYSRLFKSLADSLKIRGIASFRYDNRNFTDSLVKDNERFTMFDAADDAHSAFLALKGDKRFSTSHIGLLGHSEGGASAAIETSRNKDIDFLITLSTMGISGELIGFSQNLASIKFPLRSMPTEERNKIVKQLFIYNRILATSADLEQAKAELGRYLKSAYQNSTDKKMYFGTLDEEEVIESIQTAFAKPRKQAFIQFNPNLYYSKVKCPTLVIHGAMDTLLDCKNNSQGIERIFIENGKTNYSILTIDSVGHNFGQLENFESYEENLYKMRHNKMDKHVYGKGFTEMCDAIRRFLK